MLQYESSVDHCGFDTVPHVVCVVVDQIYGTPRLPALTSIKPNTMRTYSYHCSSHRGDEGTRAVAENMARAWECVCRTHNDSELQHRTAWAEIDDDESVAVQSHVHNIFFYSDNGLGI